MKLLKRLLSLMLLLLAYAPSVSSAERTITPQELLEHYKTMLDEAIWLDGDNKIDKARELYERIIYSPYPLPISLRTKAAYNMAEMLYNQNKVLKTPYNNIIYISELLSFVTNEPIETIDSNIWADSHLLLGQIALEGVLTPDHQPDVAFARQHFFKIFTFRANLDPLTVFKAAITLAEYVYENPSLLDLYRINMLLAYRYMIEAYGATPDHYKNEIDMPGINKYPIARFHYAQQLLQVTGIFNKRDNYMQAREILSDIITVQDPYIDQKTINRARVMLAGMNLRGEGLPNNTPDIPAAKELYKTVLSQPKNTVIKEDITKAKVALDLINLNRKRKRTEE